MVTSGHAGSLDRTDPEALVFLRQRVMAYGLVVGALGIAGLGVRFGFAATFDFLEHFLDDSMLPHAFGAFTFLLVALACRLGPLKWGYLVAVEAIGMIVGSYAYIWMGNEIPLAAHPGMIVFSVLAFGFYARAIYVPSPPRRTAILGLLILFPLVFETYRSHMDKLPQIPEMLELIDATNRLYMDGVAPATNVGEATGQAIQVGIWWLFTTMLATLARSLRATAGTASSLTSSTFRRSDEPVVSTTTPSPDAKPCRSLRTSRNATRNVISPGPTRESPRVWLPLP